MFVFILGLSSERRCAIPRQKISLWWTFWTCSSTLVGFKTEHSVISMSVGFPIGLKVQHQIRYNYSMMEGRAVVIINSRVEGCRRRPWLPLNSSNRARRSLGFGKIGVGAWGAYRSIDSINRFWLTCYRRGECDRWCSTATDKEKICRQCMVSYAQTSDSKVTIKLTQLHNKILIGNCCSQLNSLSYPYHIDRLYS